MRRLLARTRLGRALAPETRGLLQDSFVLTVASGVATAGQMAQIALMTNFLGLGAYGRFALVVASVAIASRFFDVQVGSAAIAFATRAPRDASAVSSIFRFSYVVDAFAGVAGYAVIAALAIPVANRLVGTGGSTLYFLYGITLLTGTVETTSLALLQFLGRFMSILWLTVFREFVRVALLVGFLIAFDSLRAAVIALVIVEVVFVLGALMVSGGAFRRRYETKLLGLSGWPTAEVRRPMLRMIFHTNFITYAKLVSSQAPTILLGAFRSPVDVGAFKVAMSLAAGIGKPADPAWAAVLPRLSRLWNDRRMAELRSLLVQSTVLAFAILVSGAAVVVLFRSKLFGLFAARDTQAAFGVLLLALASQIISGTLFWNSALLIAARRADIASRSYVAMGLLLAVLLPVMIDAYGAIGAASALLVSTLGGNVMLTASAVKLYREKTRTPKPPGSESDEFGGAECTTTPVRTL